MSAAIATCEVMGVECAVCDLTVATEAVLSRASSQQGGYVTLVGVHGLTSADHDADLAKAYGAAWMNFADGASTAWVQRRVGYYGARRVAGPDLMVEVMRD